MAALFPGGKRSTPSSYGQWQSRIVQARDMSPGWSATPWGFAYDSQAAADAMMGNTGGSNETSVGMATKGASPAGTGMGALGDPTKVTKANRSPELEAQMAEYLGRLNQLSGDFTSAFQGKMDTYDDVIRTLANIYQQQAGRTGTATGQAAYASGLTPLEATGQASQAMQQILQQFYPQQAQLRSAQADVPIAATQAQQGLGQDYLAQMQGVALPYYTGVAGVNEYDFLGREQLAQQQQQWAQELAIKQKEAASARGLDRQRLALEAQQLAMQQALARAELQQKMQLAQQEMANQYLLAQMNQQTQFGVTGMQGQNRLALQDMSSQAAMQQLQAEMAARAQQQQMQQQFQGAQNALDWQNKFGYQNLANQYAMGQAQQGFGFNQALAEQQYGYNQGLAQQQYGYNQNLLGQRQTQGMMDQAMKFYYDQQLNRQSGQQRLDYAMARSADGRDPAEQAKWRMATSEYQNLLRMAPNDVRRIYPDAWINTWGGTNQIDPNKLYTGIMAKYGLSGATTDPSPPPPPTGPADARITQALQ